MPNREGVEGVDGFVKRREPPSSALKRGNDAALVLIREQLDEAEFAKACEQGRALAADEAVELALHSLQ